MFTCWISSLKASYKKKKKKQKTKETKPKKTSMILMLPKDNKTRQEERTQKINQKEPKLNICEVKQTTPQKPIENDQKWKRRHGQACKIHSTQRCSSAGSSYTYKKKLQDIITCEPDKCV